MVREGEFTMTLRKLVRLNKRHELYRRPSDGEFPDHLQLRARIGMTEYRHLFAVDERPNDRARVSLRQIGDAEAWDL
jgi:hypothetical protein